MKNRIYLLTFLALLFLQATQAATINFGPNGCTLQDAIRSATDLTLQRILLNEGRLNSIIAVSGGAVIKTTDTTV